MKDQSVVIIPDIQFYTGEPKNFPVLERMVDWIIQHREEKGIQAVLQLGDLTNHNTSAEWALAKKAFAPLNDLLPYFVTTGNHDLGRTHLCSDRYTPINDFFKVGSNVFNKKALISQCRTEIQNSLFAIELNGKKWHVLMMEYGPRDFVVQWAREQIQKYAEVPTILVSHDFIDHCSTLFSKDGRPERSHQKTPGSPYQFDIAKDEGGVSSGEDLWNEFVQRSSNILLTFNGHHKPYELNPLTGQAEDNYYLVAEHRSDQREDESFCHQILFNSQWEPHGGNGLMQLVTFHPEKIEIEIISSEFSVFEASLPIKESEKHFFLI